MNRISANAKWQDFRGYRITIVTRQFCVNSDDKVHINLEKKKVLQVNMGFRISRASYIEDPKLQTLKGLTEQCKTQPIAIRGEFTPSKSTKCYY